MTTDFFSAIGADSSAGLPLPLREMRLQKEPTLALAFTTDVEAIPLHYESDETIRSYVVCLLDRCPVCFMGSSAREFLLLPVLNLEQREVQVLRIAKGLTPGSLGHGLRVVLQREGLAEQLLLLSRDGMHYRVETRPLGNSVDRCASVVDAFLHDREAGLKLSSAFPTMTPEEIAEIPRIRTKLDLLGGWPPDDDAPPDVDTDDEEPPDSPDETLFDDGDDSR